MLLGYLVVDEIIAQRLDPATHMVIPFEDACGHPGFLPQHMSTAKSGEAATSLFWVAPTRSLKELFERIHNLPDPAEVVRIAAEHEVNFLPPPA